jgi:hypothetical protein
MPYIIWIPLILMLTLTATYGSYKLNKDPNNIYWFVITWVAWSTPLWTFIARKSKNITMDGLIYDGIMVSIFSVFSAYLLTRSGIIFSYYQIFGIIFMIVSILLFKIG